MLWSYPVGPCNHRSEAGGSELEKLGQSYAIAARGQGMRNEGSLWNLEKARRRLSPRGCRSNATLLAPWLSPCQTQFWVSDL